MNEKPDKLDALLRQWRDVEPRGDFESCVRRRIRFVADEKNRHATWFDWLHNIVRQPALAIGAALAIGIVAGTLGGLHSTPRSDIELQFLASRTLAGAYVRAGAR